MSKKALLLPILICLGIGLSGCSLNKPSISSVQPVESKTTVYEFTSTKDKQVALDLLMLQSQVPIETQDYGTAGKFVTSINGLAGNNENYWAFYVNGEYAQKGVSQTILQKGDKIKFVYEKVQPLK